MVRSYPGDKSAIRSAPVVYASPGFARGFLFYAVPLARPRPPAVAFLRAVGVAGLRAVVDFLAAVVLRPPFEFFFPVERALFAPFVFAMCPA